MIHVSNHLSIVETGSAAILLLQEHFFHGFAYVDISPATIFIRFSCLLQGRAPSPDIHGVTWGPYKWAENRWVSLGLFHPSQRSEGRPLLSTGSRANLQTIGIFMFPIGP